MACNFTVVGFGDLGQLGFGSKAAGVNVVIVPNVSGTPNVAPTVGVVGLVVTLTQGTDAGGAPLIETTAAVAARIAATPAAAALLNTDPDSGSTDYVPDVGFVGGAAFVTGTTSNFTFLVQTCVGAVNLTLGLKGMKVYPA